MSIIIVCALVGLLFGGFSGLLIGAALGYALARILSHALRRGLGELQAQFLDATFATMGALCKADEQVTRDEIDAAERLFDRLHLSGEQREAARAAFGRGQAPDFDLEGELQKAARLCRGRTAMLQMFLQVQCMAVAADGEVHPAEHEMLLRIARGLGLAERDVAQLEALLRASATGAPASEQRLEDAYAALGVSPSATDGQIKRAYRRLMSQNHPDKLAGRGESSEAVREIAEERTREISAAYRVIKEARGLA